MKKIKFPVKKLRIPSVETDLWIFIGLIFYKISLDLTYIYFICDEYGYCKNFKLSMENFRIIESWLLYLGLIYVTPRKKRTVTRYYLLIQFVIMITPMISMYGFGIHPRNFMYLSVGVHFLQCFLDKLVKEIKLSDIVQGDKVAFLIILGVIVVSLLVSVLLYGVPNLVALDLTRVYEIRAKNALVFPISYFLPWFFSAIAPIILISSIEKKKYYLLLFTGVLMLWFYLTYAFKSWFFSPLMIIFVYIVVKKNKFVSILAWGMPIMISITTLLGKISEKLIMFPSLFVRRVLFVPADIKFEYYNFFRESQKLYFSNGVIGEILGLDYPYDKDITYIIGDYMQYNGASCNTGYLADGYANMGVFGIILVGVILLLILKVLDGFSEGERFELNFAILIYCLYGLNDGALLTKILTGGLGLMIILIHLLHKREKRVFKMKYNTQNKNNGGCT